MNRTSQASGARYRWGVAVRIASASVGGYALATAATVVLALLWPIPRAQAVMAATMLSFAVWAAAALWTFHARSAGRAALTICAVTGAMAALAWALGAGEGV